MNIPIYLVIGLREAHRRRKWPPMGIVLLFIAHEARVIRSSREPGLPRR